MLNCYGIEWKKKKNFVNQVYLRTIPNEKISISSSCIADVQNKDGR